MNNQLHTLLIRSLDAPLDEKEQAQLREALALTEIRHERDRFVSLRSMIKETAASTFEPLFVQRLLQRLATAQEEFRRWLVWDYRRVVIVGAVFVLLLASYNMARCNSVSLSGAFAQPEYTLEQALRLEAPFQ
jgi:hypothetical protein